MTFFIVLMIISAILLIVLIFQFFKAVRLPQQTIVAFTGTLGSGKTYLAVEYAIRAYNKQARHYTIYKLFSWIPGHKKLFKDWQYKPCMYSNIPVQLHKGKLSTPLTRDMLLQRNILPQKAIILIDELGQFASQWEFDNPLVMEQLQTFFRFYRHWIDGRIFVTDQISDGIVKPIRARVGMIYNLHDFHRFLFFLPFYKVTTIPLMLLEDETNAAQKDIESKDEYFFGFLPYKWQRRFKRYQSRCYRYLYEKNAQRYIETFNDDLYTEYLIDITVSGAQRKDYNKNRDKYKEYLYGSEEEPSPAGESGEGLALPPGTGEDTPELPPDPGSELTKL